MDGEYALTNGEKDDETCSSEKETHASTLDKLLAWEKKLHEEVKVHRSLWFFGVMLLFMCSFSTVSKNLMELILRLEKISGFSWKRSQCS
jgi:hypothetical protein